MLSRLRYKASIILHSLLEKRDIKENEPILKNMMQSIPYDLLENQMLKAIVSSIKV